MNAADDTTWTTDEELAALTEWAHGRKACVEVGTWKGRSATAIAAGMPADGRLSCVDDFSGDPDERTRRRFFPQACDDDGREDVKEAWAAALEPWLDGRVALIEERSDVASCRFGDGTLDLVFIDGCHGHEAVLDDLDCWARKLKPDGLLCGHDWTEPGVMRALQERFTGHLKLGPGKLWRAVR